MAISQRFLNGLYYASRDLYVNKIIASTRCKQHSVAKEVSSYKIYVEDYHGGLKHRNYKANNKLTAALSVRLPIIMYKKKRVCITHDVCLLIMKKYEVCTL